MEPRLKKEKQTLLDLKAFKARGFIQMKDPEFFSVRLKVVAGWVNASNLAKLASIAEKYGQGRVHLTTRQGMEIPYVHINNLEALQKSLEEAGIETGRLGPRIRTIVACLGKGCKSGLIETENLAKLIDENFKEIKLLPAKFKIAIAGCPNACTKPIENDFGIMGIERKTFNPNSCINCGDCVKVCPSKGTVDIKDDELIYNEKSCIDCGKCIKVCPTGAFESTGTAYVVFVGGKMGKRPRSASRLPFIVENQAKLLEVLKKTLAWYRKTGETKERFGDTIDRVGFKGLVAVLKG